jgi:hypothetical protein
MKTKEETKSRGFCKVCREREMTMRCDGCQIPLCSKCVKYGLYGTGCGCIQPLVLCPTCHDDPGINP